MSDGVVHDRKWLIYSKHIDRTIFFRCKIFNLENCRSSLGHDGFINWRHINGRLKEHETSMEHITTSMNSWNEIRMRLILKLSILQLNSSNKQMSAMEIS
jgi:hypothetical protein